MYLSFWLRAQLRTRNCAAHDVSRLVSRLRIWSDQLRLNPSYQVWDPICWSVRSAPWQPDTPISSHKECVNLRVMTHISVAGSGTSVIINNQSGQFVAGWAGTGKCNNLVQLFLRLIRTTLWKNSGIRTVWTCIFTSFICSYSCRSRSICQTYLKNNLSY